MHILAADPGGEGYILHLFFSEKKELSILHKYPLASFHDIDLPKLFFELSKLSGKIDFVILEMPFPFMRGSGHGLLSQGINFGYLYGLFKTLFPKVFDVRPKEWQLPLGIQGKGSDNTKKAAEDIACNLIERSLLIPERCKKPHPGIVDALLIGYYGYLNRETILKGEK